jgi:hypothetical protein
MRYLILIVTHAAIFALFFYVKAAPWKDKLDPKHRGWFDTLDGIFGKVSQMLGGSSKPYEVGSGVQWGMGEILILAILLGISLVTAAFGRL